MKHLIVAAAGLAATLSPALAADRVAVLDTYADIAHAVYEDSLLTARAMDAKIAALLKAPTDANLTAAREAWIAARHPYQQSEVYRFGNPLVDDWEGKVNAWPLDEGLIDYVDNSLYGEETDANPLYTANVIANPTIRAGGETIDASTIDKALLAEKLHEAGSVEANVATGYHAVEFLLWGQDLNGTGPGAGDRPATDFSLENCTNGNCDRRREYLEVVTDLLIDDLEEMTGMWAEGGAARAAVMEDTGRGLAMIATGMGSLSYGELAGERMKLGLILNDPEEEHDCFSDNTHWSHYNNAKGIRNIYLGAYERVDGSVVEGPSLSDLVAEKAPGVDEELRARLDATMVAMEAMVERAETTERYDQMIGEANAEGNATVQAAIDALTAQTRSIGRVVAALDLEKIEFEGSDSLDNPSAVGK